MKFRAIIFDLDGTLLDTLEDIGDSMNIVLRRFGFPEHSMGAYKYFIGDGMETLISRALPENHREAAVLTQCIGALRDEYGKRWSDKTRPYDGIFELLEFLRLREIKLAVLSNKPDDFTKTMVATFFPPCRFNAVVGSKPSVPKKPDPQAALEIAEMLEVPPPEFLFLGDSGIDMKTANAANMYPVGALWGFRAAEELRASGAKVLLEKPADLSQLL